MNIVFTSGDSVELTDNEPLAVIRNNDGIRVSVHWSAVEEMLNCNELRRAVVKRKRKAVNNSIDAFDDICPKHREAIGDCQDFLEHLNYCEHMDT